MTLGLELPAPCCLAPIRLVVSQAQVAVCTYKSIFSLLEMIDGFADLINRSLEVP
jgi:hypothetical protein